MDKIGFDDLDPDKLTIDPVNERVSNADPFSDEGESLQQSIEEQGVIEPIVVREGNDGQYKVVAGQRRTLAAQAVGVDTIPARIVEMDDAEARMVSIAENAEQYKKEVPKQDRAESIKKLIDDGMTLPEIADRMGTTEPTIRRWLEPALDYWEDTTFDTDSEDTDSVGPEDISLRALQIIRQNTDSKDRRERIAKRVVEENVKNELVREAAKQATNPKSFEREIGKKIKELNSGTEKVRKKVHLSGKIAEELNDIMKNRGIDEKTAIESLVEERILRIKKEREGELIQIVVEPEITEGLDNIIDDRDLPRKAVAKAIIKRKLKDSGNLDSS